MAMLQVILHDELLARLDQYRRSQPYPVTKTAVAAKALEAWLDAEERRGGAVAVGSAAEDGE